MRALSVLYVVFLAGAFTGCASYLRLVVLRHREERS